MEQRIPHFFNYTFKSRMSPVLYRKSHDWKCYCTGSHLTGGFILLLVTCYQVTAYFSCFGNCKIYTNKLYKIMNEVSLFLIITCGITEL